MKKVEEYTIPELEELLKQKREEQKLIDADEFTKLLYSVKNKLHGLDYVLFNHGRVIELFELDPTYEPDIKEDKWVGVKPLRSIWLISDVDKELSRGEKRRTYHLDSITYHSDAEYAFKRPQDTIKYLQPVYDIEKMTIIDGDFFNKVWEKSNKIQQGVELLYDSIKESLNINEEE
jgi:hypothetical protein